MTALAIILSYVESLVSAGVILPGIKLGLSNIPVVVTLCTFGLPYALFIGTVKSIVSLMIFGRLSGLLYSLLGIIFAIIAMSIIKRFKSLSLLSVSVGGSLFHIVGQLTGAAIMLKTWDTFSLLPVLGAFAIVSGVITYIPERFILDFIKKYFKQ